LVSAYARVPSNRFGFDVAAWAVVLVSSPLKSKSKSRDAA
jgi:hypothetical protein